MPAVWPTQLHDQRGSINGANMGPFEDFYGAIMGLTVYIYWEILRLFLWADFTYKYQFLSTTVLTIKRPDSILKTKPNNLICYQILPIVHQIVDENCRQFLNNYEE